MLQFLSSLNKELLITIGLAVIFSLGMAWWGRLMQSEKFLRLALRLLPNQAGLHLRLGQVLADRPELRDEAERELRQAIVLNPDNRSIRYALLHILWDKPTWQYDIDAFCRDYFQHFPDDPYGYEILGRWYGRQERHADAERAYRKAIELAPRFGNAYELLAGSLALQGRFDEAQELYTRHKDILSRDTSRYHLLAGIGLSDKGEHEKAVNELNRAIQKEPGAAHIHFVLAEILFAKLNRLAEAEQAYRTGLALNPNSAGSYANYGLLLGKYLNRLPEAEQAYRTAIELQPTEVQPYIELGWLLAEKLQRPEEAEQMYLKAMELRPNDPRLYTALGTLRHAHFHRYAEAEAMLRRALELKPDDKTALYNAACARSRLNDTEAAFEYLRKAIKHGADRAWAWNDPDLESLRSDPRFMEIAGPRPEPAPAPVPAGGGH